MIRTATNISLVVTGAMNPRLHHPMWYRMHGLLDDEELKAALEADTTIVSPHIAQFQIGPIAISCTDDRWEAKSADVSLKDRVQGIASKAFTVLGETPISAFGINVTAIFPIDSVNVGRSLGDMVSGLPLGLPSATEKWAEIRHRAGFGDVVRQTRIWPAGGDPGNLLAVEANCHHAMTTPPGVHFDLGEIIANAFQADYAEADERVTSVATNFGRTVRS